MTPKRFCVIGLGYFGQYLALKLSEAGAEVLAIDRDEDRVDAISDKITYAVTMDSTDAKTLHSLGLQDMDAVIVAIGEGFESSILTTAVLQEIGVKRILNRITSPIHERLLKLMSIDELLVPEAEAAAQLANRLMI
ncbi:MAG: TrkA family potassium uptake protein, partial [Bacteroidota bacterium]